jgi:hypothetical protein
MGKMPKNVFRKHEGPSRINLPITKNRHSMKKFVSRKSVSIKGDNISEFSDCSLDISN